MSTIDKEATETTIALIKNDLAYIRAEVKEIRNLLESKYVTQDEFKPVKQIVYGIVSVVLLSVLGALIGLVIIK